ncbi:chemotaxis-specific protein-glutamate methyltransferase CheB [Lachnospiraceae bacterium ZAX-1]
MKKNILVVDDSALMRRVICDIINTDSMFQATDVCRDGREAYEQLKKKKYDGVILDVNMPRMDGLELLEKLKQDRIKATIIVVSKLTTKDAKITMLAMERGAVDFVAKPDNVIEAKGAEFKKQVLEVLSAIIKHGNTDRFLNPIPKGKARTMDTLKAKATPTGKKDPTRRGGKKLVALACSTGGPKSLQSVIPFLPQNMDAPMVLVQHMPKGFTKSMADRLDELSKVHVKEAEEGDILQKGWVYVAPGGKHMQVARTADGEHCIRLNDEPPIGGLRPCANITYQSLKTSGFDEITCVVLTGMGADGTDGIQALKKRKALYVISQDAQTCVVYGMPKALAEAGLVDEVVPLTEVAQSIIKNVGVR